MSNNNLKLAHATDLELLDKAILYLSNLCPLLPFFRLEYHCKGAMASLFELLFYLKSHNLNNYGNNKK